VEAFPFCNGNVRSVFPLNVTAINRGIMKEITNRSVIIILPKEPSKNWARLYNEISIKEIEQRLLEKHAYLIDWTYNEKIDDVLSAYHTRIFEY
jgi:hypothetical protein